jgi:AraC-like DNA-binding protein
VTERLLSSVETDAVDALLRDVRVASTVYCRSILTAPWGFGVRAHGLAAFHVVTRGDCWLELDEVSEPSHLRAGDVVILPRGETHWMRDELGSPGRWLEDLLAETPVDAGLRLRTGGGGAQTDLLCGVFGIEGARQHPVIAALPRLVHLPRDGKRELPWLAPTLELIALEVDSPRAGAAVVSERLSEVLLAHVLRAALIELEEGDGLNLERLRGSGIAPAVRAIHERPEHTWTLGELAGLATMSRSTFAARFHTLTGETPIRYLTRCRLARAARQLRTSDATLAEVARQAGYSSEFSFSRAFKRGFGVAPAFYRERGE